MIYIKSSTEIAKMRESGKIVYNTLKEVEKHIKAGITTRELDRIAKEYILSQGAKPSFLGYNGYPASICASINEVVIHGIPSQRKLEDGDIISIDVGAVKDGYHGDAARTFAVGKISDEAQRLIDVTKQSFFEGLKYARPDNRLSDISHAIESYVKKFGYTVVLDFTGHGVGRHLHEDPAVPNYGQAGHGPLLKEGMTLAIEPMVNMGTHRVKILQDGWTTVTADKKMSAHYEHSIVITKDGYEILTKLKENE